jgi:acetyl esterase/lipase
MKCHLLKAAACFLLIATATAIGEVEKQVSFKGADGTILRGTLLLPTDDPSRRFPALVLLQGSGPTNREGNQLPWVLTNFLKQIAGAMADHGIATLRFDKRGMYANKSELPKDPNLYGDFYRWEKFAGDVRSAYEFLSTQPQIDPQRVGILGHSEGGSLALIVGNQLQSEGHPPATLILIGAIGRSFDVVIAEQLNRLVKQFPADHAKLLVDANERIMKSIRDTGTIPADVPAELQPLYHPYLGKFLQSDFATNTTKLAAQFSGPVLVINGEKDIQVSAERDAKPLDEALKSRKVDDHELFIVPNASHNLKVVVGPADPGMLGDIAPGVLEKIARWCDAKLIKRPATQP